MTTISHYAGWRSSEWHRQTVERKDCPKGFLNRAELRVRQVPIAQVHWESLILWFDGVTRSS